jgi:CRISPR-associated protein Csm3
MGREEGNMKLIGYKKIEGTIEVITGLHIGGSTTIIEIGGNDNPVIKHPITKEPYIPGSSLKGKMRSLLEWKLGKINADHTSKDFGEVHKWCNDSNCPICVIFGTSAEDAGIGPTRLVVRDAFLDKSYKQKQKEKTPNWSMVDITEDKYENTINRITARANPRNFERVVSGVIFSFSMSYRIFGNGNGGSVDEKLFEHVLDGLKLIEKDALGGAGSRGCGQVLFKININGEYKALDKVGASDFNTVT